MFATATGEPLDTSTVTRAFPDSIRTSRACATLHLEAGEELVVVSRILGHSTISTTADVYAHVTPAMLERSAERMDTILGRRADTA